MPGVHYEFSDFPAFAKTMREAAPRYAAQELGRAMHLMGKSDIQKMEKDQLSGGSLNIRSKAFLHSFKSKASDSREAKTVDDLKLEEWTGAKPMRIFQTGGEVQPTKSRLMTILTDAARTAGGKRKFSQKELQQMIQAGQAKIIQTKAGPAIIKVDPTTTKSGRARQIKKITILAWLKPRVSQRKRIDFFANYDNNAAEHERIFGEAAQRAIDKTIADEGD